MFLMVSDLIIAYFSAGVPFIGVRASTGNRSTFIRSALCMNVEQFTGIYQLFCLRVNRL